MVILLNNMLNIFQKSDICHNTFLIKFLRSILEVKKKLGPPFKKHLKTLKRSKLTIETLKKEWKMFQANNKDTRTRFGVFFVDFEYIHCLS